VKSMACEANCLRDYGCIPVGGNRASVALTACFLSGPDPFPGLAPLK
jgi:hypothetical protein